MANSDWDLDLRDGLAGEDKVASLLSIDTIEVKTDRRWKETGNVYIETECYYVASQSWKPSGIMVSKATHWALVLEEMVVIIPTDVLRKTALEWGQAITCDIEPNPSKGYLVKPYQVIEWYKWKKQAEEIN